MNDNFLAIIAWPSRSGDECSITPGRVGGLARVCVGLCSARKEKRKQEKKRTQGVGSVVEQRSVAITVRVRADRRTRHPGAVLVDVLAPTGGGGSSSLAYVRGRSPRSS